MHASKTRERRGADSRAAQLTPTLVERRRRPRETATSLDIPWTHTPLGDIVREAAGRFVLSPLMALYTRRRVLGRERLDGLREPVVIVANHGSHMDTPALLRALPRRIRRRTIVAAAVDYFYRDRRFAMFVSVLFNTVPIERRREARSLAHIDALIKRGNSLILYPEGTRSRRGKPGRLRAGAAVVAARHGALLVPVRIRGTHDAMPPGSRWMRRRSWNPLARRHRVTITFGTPVVPQPDDCDAVMRQVAEFFEDPRAPQAG